jgi:integrase
MKKRHIVGEDVCSVSLTKKPGCRYWYLCFRVKRHFDDGNTKWGNRWKSTRTDDQDEATRLWLTPARDTLLGRRREQALEEAWQLLGATGLPPRVPLCDLWEWYEKHAEVTGSYKQIRERRAMLAYMLRWLAKEHPEIQFLHEVNIRIAGEFWKFMENDQKAPRTRNKYRSQLKLVWDGVTISAELKINPWEKLPTDRGRGLRYEDLSAEQIKSLCEAAETYASQWPGFWPCALRLAAETGLREGDIATLEREELHFDQGYLILVPNKTKHWQSGRVAVHSLDRPWVALLPEVESGYLWPRVAADSIGNSGGIGGEFRELCERIGLTVEREPEPGERRKRAVKLYTFHSLRHGFATMVLDTGQVTKADLVTQGNWASEDIIGTTYDHRDKLRLAKAAADKVASALPKW